MRNAKKELKGLFNPKNIAVIGASSKESTVGYGLLKNLLKGSVLVDKRAKGFGGKVFPVNPKGGRIQGHKAYKNILEIKESVDLAVIAVNVRFVADVMKECVEKKVKAAIIISAGFAELGEKGNAIGEEVLKIAKKGNIRIVGPNCLGVIMPNINMNASFAPTTPPKGNIAFLSQSGALADSIIDWAVDNRYGFSGIVSYGNKLDLDAADFLEYFAEDKGTKAIAMYIEGVADGKRFLEVAKKVAKKKPVIMLKAGKSAKGQAAISSHTGSLAGDYKIYEAVAKQSGMTIATTVEELFDFAKVFTEQPIIKNNIAIITNGGGCGVLAADYCEDLGVNLVKLQEKTLKKIEKSGVMHPAYSRRNPLDIVGDALPERYEVAINRVLEQKDVGGIIVIQTLQTMTDTTADAKIAIAAKKKFKDKAVLCTYMGGKYSKDGIRYLEEHNISDYNDPSKAVKAISALIKRYEFLKGKKWETER